MSLYNSLTIENYNLNRDIAPFAWTAAAVVVVHLVLAVATLLLSPIQFDRRSGTVGRGGWVPGWWGRDLKDIVAIQICRGKTWVMHGDRARDTKIALQYDLNLVFDDSPPSRRNLSHQDDLQWAKRAARQIADFLDKPVLNYVGDIGTIEATDAEARRLLA